MRQAWEDEEQDFSLGHTNFETLYLRHPSGDVK